MCVHAQSGILFIFGIHEHWPQQCQEHMEVQAAKQWQRQIHANVIPLHLPICTEESTTFCKLNYISHIKPYNKKKHIKP